MLDIRGVGNAWNVYTYSMISACKLEILHEHQDDAFPVIGEPAGIYWNQDRSHFAVVSVWEPGINHVRPSFRSAHAQRLTIHDARSKALLGALSDIPGGVTHVAMHPRQPLVLICTGRYDGGYLFEGALLCWNWETGERRTLAAGPAFYAARFDDGDVIYALLSPDDEEDCKPEQDPFDTYHLLTVALPEIPASGLWSEQIRPFVWRDVVLPIVQLDPPQLYGKERTDFARESFTEVRSLFGINSPRHSFVDLVPTEIHLLAMKSHPVMEWRTIEGQLLQTHDEDFIGSQAFRIHGDDFLICSNEPVMADKAKGRKCGRLARWNPSLAKPKAFLEVPTQVLVSQSVDGNLLVRTYGSDNKNTREDFRAPHADEYLLDRHLHVKRLPRLGPFYGILHCITSKGSRRLYAVAHNEARKDRDLFALDPATRQWERLDQVDRRPDPPQHAGHFVSSEFFAPYASGADEDLIVAGHIANLDLFPCRVWRHHLRGQRWIWQRDVSERIQLLHSLPEHGVVLVGLDDGALVLLDAESGEPLDRITLSAGGIPSIATAACTWQDRIVLGTLEGRLLHLKINRG